MNLPTWVSESELKALVLEEKESSFKAIKNKRELFLNRYALYNNISNSDNKIYVRLIRSTIQTLLGLYYTDEISVSFNGRQLWDEDVVETYENLAKFDQEEMEMAKINYDTQWNRLFYWVGIRVFDHWDSFRKVPVYRSIDPMSWYPDPMGYINNHRYHWFDLEVVDSDLTDDIYFNVDKIENTKEQELKHADSRRKEIRELQEEVKNWVINPKYHVYNHFTTINGKKYLVTLANDGDLIIRCEFIKEVYLEEKKGQVEVPFPVILNFYEPIKWDPFGMCIPDLLEDKQKAEQLFMNLNRIKAENEALGDIFMVDTNAIQNINDLKQPRRWPKYIKADMRQNNNPIVEVAKSRVKGDALNMPEIIRNQWSEDTGIDSRTLWVSNQSGVTATENQRTQKNANIKLLLGNKINQWGEKDFWRDWMRRYFEYFEMSDEKNIKLNNGFWATLLTIKRKDIATWYDIDVQVINKSQEEEINQKKLAWYLAIAEIILQDPEAARISKLFCKRSIAKLQGIPREERNILFYDPIEEDAKQHLELINGEESVIELMEWEDDHESYLLVYHRAMDNKFKQEAIIKRKEFIGLRGRNTQPTQSLWGIAWAAVNASLQQGQEQWATSLMDINAQ